ncbi:MAG: hypothetical protein P1V36_11625, partial [Planctomycetota bacterium]|nr:hypothetical protein [Planctomycetota bacterium]
MARRLPLAVLLVALVVAPSFAGDREDRPARHAPQKNFSHLHDDAQWVVTAFAAAEGAAEAGNWSAVLAALQPVIDQRVSRESSTDAAPYVHAVHGSATYEGAWLVARHRLQALGADALKAYAR